MPATHESPNYHKSWLALLRYEQVITKLYWIKSFLLMSLTTAVSWYVYFTFFDSDGETAQSDQSDLLFALRFFQHVSIITFHNSISRSSLDMTINELEIMNKSGVESSTNLTRKHNRRNRNFKRHNGKGNGNAKCKSKGRLTKPLSSLQLGSEASEKKEVLSLKQRISWLVLLLLPGHCT